MFFASIIVAVFGLATLGRSHMKMSTPTPYGKSSLDTDPLSFNGSDFPCKQRTGVYDIEGATNTMPLGSVQPLEFIGIIVHGGGSCQVSITYDHTFHRGRMSSQGHARQFGLGDGHFPRSFHLLIHGPSKSANRKCDCGMDMV
jgi:hypothetical protein